MRRRPKKLRLNATSNVRKPETTVYNDEASATDHEKAVKPRLNFLQLPRELRDEVYMQYCYSTPRSSGPLEGYTDIPSPAPLAVCKQMREEMSPILYESLEYTLVQDRVCLKLHSSSSSSSRKPTTPGPGPARTRYIGWSVWALDWCSSGRSFNVWVRDGDGADEEGRYARWWVDARNLYSLKFTKFETPFGTEYAPQAFEQLVRTLEKLQVVAPKITEPLAVRRRLNCVIFKVLNTLAEVKKEAEKEKAKLETSSSNWLRSDDAMMQSLPGL